MLRSKSEPKDDRSLFIFVVLINAVLIPFYIYIVWSVFLSTGDEGAFYLPPILDYDITWVMLFVSPVFMIASLVINLWYLIGIKPRGSRRIFAIAASIAVPLSVLVAMSQ